MDSRSAINKKSFAFYKEQQFGFFANIVHVRKEQNKEAGLITLKNKMGASPVKEEMSPCTLRRHKTYSPVKRGLQDDSADDYPHINEDGEVELKMKRSFSRK